MFKGIKEVMEQAPRRRVIVTYDVIKQGEFFSKWSGAMSKYVDICVVIPEEQRRDAEESTKLFSFPVYDTVFNNSRKEFAAFVNMHKPIAVLSTDAFVQRYSYKVLPNYLRGLLFTNPDEFKVFIVSNYPEIPALVNGDK